MENIELKVLEDKLTQWHVVKEAWLQFCLHEPLCSMITALHEPNNKHLICQPLYDGFKLNPDSPCIIAWDKEKHKTAGMINCYNLLKTQPSDDDGNLKDSWLKQPWDENTASKLRGLFDFLDLMMEKADVLNRYGVDKALLIDSTSVLPEYRQKGIANAMTAKVLEVARERGYPIVVAESTSAYTQRNKINRFGFEPLLQLDFENNYANYAEMPDDVKKTHSRAFVLIKKLY